MYCGLEQVCGRRRGCSRSLLSQANTPKPTMANAEAHQGLRLAVEGRVCPGLAPHGIVPGESLCCCWRIAKQYSISNTHPTPSPNASPHPRRSSTRKAKSVQGRLSRSTSSWLPLVRAAGCAVAAPTLANSPPLPPSRCLLPQRRDILVCLWHAVQLQARVVCIRIDARLVNASGPVARMTLQGGLAGVQQRLQTDDTNLSPITAASPWRPRCVGS